MEQAVSKEYLVSPYCSLGDCVGFGEVFIDQDTDIEMLEVVDTKNPNEVRATVPRRDLAMQFIAIQEGLITPEDLLAMVDKDEPAAGIKFLKSFSAEEVRAFYEGVKHGAFDTYAGVHELEDEIPLGGLEEFLRGVTEGSYGQQMGGSMPLPMDISRYARVEIDTFDDMDNLARV